MNTTTHRRTSNYSFAVTVPGATGADLTALVARMFSAAVTAGHPVSESWISTSAETAYVVARLRGDDSQVPAVRAMMLDAADRPATVAVHTGLGAHRRTVEE